MFQHPTLKGKKAKKVRKLSFEFVDDTKTVVDPNQTSNPMTSAEIVTEMREDSQKVDDYYQTREDVQEVQDENNLNETEY